MNVARFHQHGGPEVIRYEDAPIPSPGPGEALIRVKACALNHLDLWIRQGIPAFQVPLPHIGGCDVAGLVEQVGASALGGGQVAAGGVDTAVALKPGDRVFVSPGLSCWRCEFCLSGRDNLCVAYRILGAQVDGGMAEFVTVPAINVLPIPGSLSFEQAAAFPLTAVTAWHMLFSLAKLQPAEDLLVLGAGSGVGSMAIQMARAAGARVLTTVGSDEKVAQALALGAEVVLDHRREDLAERVRQATNGRGVDVVIEHIGPATWEQSLKSLAKGGRLITCGATSGPEVKLDLRYLYMRQTTVIGSIMGTRADLLAAAKWMGEGRITSVIDAVLPLAEARVAHERMLDRKLFGKIVLTP